MDSSQAHLAGIGARSQASAMVSDIVRRHGRSEFHFPNTRLREVAVKPEAIDTEARERIGVMAGS